MISIVVPVYNTEAYLDKCVKSIINQTYSDIELLLIDDGSTDKSGILCDDWAKKDSRIKVIHKENGGLVSSWKRGVAEASGQYLMFVDSDDWIDTNMLAEMSLFLSDSNAEIIASDYIIERAQSNGLFEQEYVYQTLSPKTYNRNEIEQKVFPELLGNEHRPVAISRCMKLISRELILNNIKYTDDSIQMAEDLSIMLPSLYDCQRLIIMDHKAYYHYLYKIDSMAHKYDAGMYNNFVRLKEMLRNVIADKFGSSSPQQFQLERLDKEFIHSLLLCVKNESRGNPRGYRKNIRQIYSLQEDLIETCPVSVSDASNKLLYWTLKKPSWFRLSILRLAMIIYYR